MTSRDETVNVMEASKCAFLTGTRTKKKKEEDKKYLIVPMEDKYAIVIAATIFSDSKGD